jgi:hypothetical protein
MRPSVLTFLGLVLLCPSISQCQVTAAGAGTAVAEKPGAWHTLKLVNTTPTPNDARNFGSAFPIGNGRLGAKVFGWPADETIPLNDTTLWSGQGPEHFEDPKHRTALLATRAALAKGDYVSADKLVRGMEGPNTQFYEPLADMHIRFPGHEAYVEYSNTLDLDTATVTTRYTVIGADGATTRFTREMFVSYAGDRSALDGGSEGGAQLFRRAGHATTLWHPDLDCERSPGNGTSAASHLRALWKCGRAVGRTQGHVAGCTAAYLYEGRHDQAGRTRA